MTPSSQETLPALINSFLEEGAGCRAVAGSPAGREATFSLRGSPGHMPCAPVLSTGGCTAQAEPSCQEAFLLAHPLPAACSGAGEGAGTLHTPSTTPAAVVWHSCLGATSQQSTAGRQESRTHMAQPNSTAPGCGAAAWSRAGGC